MLISHIWHLNQIGIAVESDSSVDDHKGERVVAQEEVNRNATVDLLAGGNCIVDKLTKRSRDMEVLVVWYMVENYLAKLCRLPVCDIQITIHALEVQLLSLLF